MTFLYCLISNLNNVEHDTYFWHEWHLHWFYNCDTQIEWLLISSELYCFDDFLSTFLKNVLFLKLMFCSWVCVMKLSDYEICALLKLKYDRLLEYIVELMYMWNWLFLLKYGIKFLHCWAYVHQIEETYKIVFLHCWDYSSLLLDCLAYVYIKLM